VYSFDPTFYNITLGLMSMKLTRLIVVGLCAFAISGCAVQPFQSGMLFSQHKIPAAAPNQSPTCTKTGTGKTTNILGLFAFGDASVAAAKKNAGIAKVDTVDVSYFNVLGLFGETTIEVCGQ